jgi:hypothetical protein
MIREGRPDQSCLLRRGDYRNKDHKPEILSWIRVLVRLFAVAQTTTRQKNGAKTKVVGFHEKVTVTVATTRKNCPGVESR